jgi:hypothetical protein
MCVCVCVCVIPFERVLTLDSNWPVCHKVCVDVTKIDPIIFSKEFKEVLRAGGLADESAAVLADLGRLCKGGGYTLS